ncbi:MAG: FAD-binding oxidoreductase [Gammaproteobacteria bacterium]|nr:FAD-binding oxidoreductase [Gammaproteobacteria bacterium]
MTESRYTSWGRCIDAGQQILLQQWRHLPIAAADACGSILPFGNGRSYGDSCLNDGGTLLDARPLRRFITFDAEAGVLCCESGVLIDEILALIVPLGWFLPVVPGTRYVTVGGAIANDVHGKNHHRQGTFGNHVRAFELLRSDGNRQVLRAGDDNPLFAATIGGLGLTGLVTWAEIQLRRIDGPRIDQEVIRFGNLDAFFDLSAESDSDHEYTVAWIDCLAPREQLGRGVFMRGNHAATPAVNTDSPSPARLGMPLTPPFSLVNRASIKAFNRLYLARHRRRWQRRSVDFASFFFPLDGVRAWNRIYGPKGLLQYQCVIPTAAGRHAIRSLLERIADAGTGSFLAVLKVFGERPSPGLLSFPQPGVTLALDFPNQGPRVHALFDTLDSIVREAGGRLYPAKDAHMSAADFKRAYPAWRELEALRDPLFDSSFWRRVEGHAT